ncbi:MAG: ankyrin repeat domain-containing protein [Halieaceae bacterium]
MAETEVEIYVVNPADDLIDKVEALLLCDNEPDFREIVASLGTTADEELSLDPEFTPDEIKLFKGYLRADFTAGSDGEEIAQAWTAYLSRILPTATVHAWGHQDGMWEFWRRGEQGKVEGRQDEPDGNDEAIIDDIYRWWHKGLPAGVKTGLLAKKFKRPGRKPAARKKPAAKKSDKTYKGFYEAWEAQDYDYIAQKVTKRNLYSKQNYDSNPEMLLQFGLRKLDERIIGIVLDAGFDLSHSDIGGKGWNILHWLCKRRRSGANSAESQLPLLIERGADATKVSDFQGHTPLMFACGNAMALPVKALCEAGAEVNLTDREGRTPLFELSRSRDIPELVECIDTLAASGADLQHRDVAGETALFDMVAQSREGGVRRLVELGLDINARDNEGNTPLFRCCWSHQMDFVGVCLELGADPLAENKQGRRAFDESSHLRELLLEGGHIQPSDIREE